MLFPWKLNLLNYRLQFESTITELTDRFRTAPKIYVSKNTSLYMYVPGLKAINYLIE